MKNRIASEKRLGLAILAMVLAALLLFTACAPRPVMEGEPVEVGWLLPLTGGGAGAMQPMLAGGEDYIRYFNEQEAIPGVRIELLWRDTALQVALGLSQYERLVAAGTPVIVLQESPLLLALKERLERDEVVALFPAPLHETTYPYFAWCYSMAPTTPEVAAVVLQYFMGNWKEERAPRLAVVHNPTGTSHDVIYALDYAKGLGFEVLPTLVVPLVVLDATTELITLSETGTDLLYMQLIAEGVAAVLRDAERLGLLGEFECASHPMTIGDRTINLAGAAASGGLSTARSYPWFDETEVPGIKLMTDNMMKYHGEVRREPEVFMGWISAAVMCEAISRAIENVGYENLDGLAIKEALDGMKDFDVYGLASITYKPDDHRGHTKMALYEVKAGDLIRVSDWNWEAPSGRDWKYE